jgi:hypothetical protein
MTEYNYSVKIRDKEIKFRKWKVKDKKAFLTALENNDVIGTEAIVYDCLENPNIALSEEEFKYVMMHIRRESVGKELSFDIECDKCEKEYTFTDDILNIQIAKFKPFGIIRSGSASFKMGEIANKEYYQDAIRQCSNDEEKFFIDFLYHIKEMNGSDAFTFDGLYNYVNDLDIAVGEDIFKQWQEMKLTFESVHSVECPHCKNKEYIQFDELYGFFPDSWFE